LASNVPGADDPVLRAKVLGILDAAENRNITLPKKRLSWEEMVELGMKYILREGYTPVDINDAELVGFKEILRSKEQFCMKVRKETLDLVDKAVKAWLYLGSIQKQEEFQLYVINQKQQEKAIREGKRQAFQEQQGQIVRERQEAERQQISEGKQARRQNMEQERLQSASERQSRMREAYDKQGYGSSY
jgi:hypothetical protein